tara:strand:+ start:1723 stop:3234 length:1512 start_codon:yes stop_codon:yes gene_type:complete
MAAIITEKFRQSNADAFSADIASSKYYMFVGKSQPWTSEGATSDSAPPTPVDSVAPESYYWDDMLAAKLISSKSFVIPRRDWSASSAFDMYRHDIGGVSTGNYGTTKTTSSSGATNLFDSTFYFKTSTHNVYKVLYNADPLQTGASNIGGSEPTNTGNAPFFSGSYLLKYMYTMSTTEVVNYLTTDFMPVKVNANSAANRGVYVFMVTSGGSSYPNGTYYTKLKGDGSGAIAKIVVSGGSIQVFGENASTASQMQANGTGYSFATFDLTGSTNIFTDASASTLISSTTLTNWNNATAGTIKAIIDPASGHGADDIEELGGHFVMLQSKFEPGDADAVQVNDFRRVGIVKNPIDSATSSVAALATARTTNAIHMASGGSGTYQVDEKITQASTLAEGRVVEWDATNRILYYVQEKYSTYGVLNTGVNKGNLVLFSGLNAVSGATSGAAFTPNDTDTTVNGVSFTDGYANPELSRDTGEIIYVENRRAISRASDQTEDIKVVVEF